MVNEIKRLFVINKNKSSDFIIVKVEQSLVYQSDKRGFSGVRFSKPRLEGVEQVVLFQEVTQVFTDVFLQHFRKNGEHRNRSIVVLVISTAVSSKNRGNFCDLPGSRESLCRQAVIQ